MVFDAFDAVLRGPSLRFVLCETSLASAPDQRTNAPPVPRFRRKVVCLSLRSLCRAHGPSERLRGLRRKTRFGGRLR